MSTGTYRVSWSIEVDAESAAAAAEIALRIHRDHESIATVFDVDDGSGSANSLSSWDMSEPIGQQQREWRIVSAGLEIDDRSELPLYFSNETGWGSYADATVFTASQRENFKLPGDGIWAQHSN